MKTVEELFDFSTTSSFGTDVDKEIMAEVLLSLITPKKSIPYYRAWGTELAKSEARPITISGFLSLTTQAVESIQKYNDDINSKDERRVAISQENIEIFIDEQTNGIVEMQVPYIQLKDLVQFQIGTSNGQ